MKTTIEDKQKNIKLGNCPVCEKKSVEKYRPFCSKRCSYIDLSKWLNEDYKIETDDDGL